MLIIIQGAADFDDNSAGNIGTQFTGTSHTTLKDSVSWQPDGTFSATIPNFGSKTNAVGHAVTAGTTTLFQDLTVTQADSTRVRIVSTDPGFAAGDSTDWDYHVFVLGVG